MKGSGRPFQDNTLERSARAYRGVVINFNTFFDPFFDRYFFKKGATSQQLASKNRPESITPILRASRDSGRFIFKPF
jgi:hypothetical protein